jgi:hypothetical protein
MKHEGDLEAVTASIPFEVWCRIDAEDQSRILEALLDLRNCGLADVGERLQRVFAAPDAVFPSGGALSARAAMALGLAELIADVGPLQAPGRRRLADRMFDALEGEW